MVAQTLVFIAGIWAAMEFCQATDPLTAQRWGLPAAVLLLASLTMKLSRLPALHANRVLRELKRVELQIAHSRKD